MTIHVASPAKSIHIISLGVGEKPNLAESTIKLLKNIDVIIGSQRQLNTIHVYEHSGVELELPKLTELEDIVQQFSGKSIAVLASGDALFYGIGNWFNRKFSKHRLIFHPNISSIQAACHEVGLDAHQMEVVSLHGRPLSTLRASIQNQRHYALFTDSGSTPNKVAEQLNQLGFENSTLWVCERLGYPNQVISQFSVKSLLDSSIDVDPLHVTLIKTQGRGGILPEFPGIADAAFATEKEQGQGLLTKREVRLNVLSLLQPTANDVGWDIGAGCGGVAIEWARWNRLGHVYAIERNSERYTKLLENREHFGVGLNLTTLQATAPACLSKLPKPNAVFVGGTGGSIQEILNYAWNALAIEGRLVATGVTEQTKAELLAFATAQFNAEAQWVEIAVSRGDKLAGHLLMRPQLPVTIMTLTKSRRLM
ncbi:MAG: precorrin-6y C5,15-methyltransferase (decarboxylating) subunit CbiE [Spongiibacteraceae bacterium]